MIRKIKHNIDNEKVTTLNNDAEFVHFMRKIAEENDDHEMSITCLGEAMDYLNNYCSNLTLLKDEEVETNIEKLLNEDHQTVVDKVGNYLEFIGEREQKDDFLRIAWESPFQYAKDDILGIHGVLYVESPTGGNYLKFHTSWEWLMPVALNLLNHYNMDCISKRKTIEEIFDDVVEAIEKINKNNKVYGKK